MGYGGGEVINNIQYRLVLKNVPREGHKSGAIYKHENSYFICNS